MAPDRIAAPEGNVALEDIVAPEGIAALEDIVVSEGNAAPEGLGLVAAPSADAPSTSSLPRNPSTCG